MLAFWVTSRTSKPVYVSFGSYKYQKLFIIHLPGRSTGILKRFCFDSTSRHLVYYGWGELSKFKTAGPRTESSTFRPSRLSGLKASAGSFLLCLRFHCCPVAFFARSVVPYLHTLASH